MYHSPERDIPGSNTALIDFLNIVNWHDDTTAESLNCNGLRNASQPYVQRQYMERLMNQLIDLQRFF